ncbi:MAG: response regulator [Ferruginibacter sp.]
MDKFIIPARILLVDDDEDDISLFSDALSQLSTPLTCTVARNGRDGIIKALMPPPYVLIFMDLNMPIMNGYECMKQIKENAHLNHIPIIVLSTSANVYELEKSKLLGASAYFTKPNDFNSWVNILNDVLILGKYVKKDL